MKINTTVLGEIEIDERQVFDFPSGLLGMPQLTQFALIDSGHPPYFYLQSLVEPYLSFALISPEIFRPDYQVDVDESEFLPLGLEPGKNTELLVFVIVNFNDTPLITANLQGPLVFNKETGKGCQCISRNTEYKTRHDVVAEMAELKKKREGLC